MLYKSMHATMIIAGNSINIVYYILTHLHFENPVTWQILSVYQYLVSCYFFFCNKSENFCFLWCFCISTKIYFLKVVLGHRFSVLSPNYPCFFLSEAMTIQG